MEQVKGCYVSIPFGRKLNPVSGALVDYDQIYNEIIRPTVEHAGLTCSRADEFYGGTLVLKSIFSAVIGTELQPCSRNLLRSLPTIGISLPARTCRQ